MFCAGFRHPAGFHGRVVLDGVAFQLGQLEDDHDVEGVLGVDRVVPIVVRVLVSWQKGRVNEEDEVLVVKGR